MPFFVVDDGAHSHPKILRAGNAAVGLWSRIGSYVAQHLTDGHVPGEVAAMYGSAPQIRKLLAAGLWHDTAHTCPRCPAVRPGDFYMHDYRESGNPSRAEVLDRRERAAAKKRQQRAGGAGQHRRGGNPAAGSGRPGHDSQPNLDDFYDDSSADLSPDSDDSPGQGDASPGDSPGTSRARDPLHSTPLHKGAEEREAPAGSGARGSGPAPSLIPADWTPSPEDVRAAQLAREDAGRPLLTEQQLVVLTRKFVRRQLDDQSRAAAWGGRWQQWAETERVTATAGSDGVVVQFPPGSQTKSQQQRAGLAALRERLQGGTA
ncbi:hypothetical protein [Streptomyces sp. NPDC008125]|uniref:hypothetical protein n=1 Tax=Streptomyces sp. NPDC008125 TaxID=3364811 RepID=UPI0036E32C3B